jgi:Mrp family chromosome partitioning ATPase
MRILRGTTSWEDCIVQTSVPGLCLLPSKPGHDRVAPFAFQRLLTELKSHFGLLLIDVGTFDETTALSLAGLCTATYLTIRQGHTTKDRARAAQRQLKSNGANLAGCVLISPAA